MRFGFFAALLLLSACAVNPRVQYQPLLGETETELVQQLGVPTRTYETGGLKFLAYDERHVTVLPATPVWGPMWEPWYGFPPEVVETGCEVTFELDQGRVRTFALRGDTCT